MTDGPIRKRVTVHGRVQGVFFRSSTQDRAEKVGVRGWVRNCADGSVEAVFEGNPAQVSEMVEFCRTGPSWARVTRIEVVDEQPQGIEGFRIR